MISEILWKSLVVMPATMAIALSMSTTAIAESIPANIETVSNPVSPLSSEDLQPSIEALSNPVTSAIAESIPANIETASNPVLTLSSEDLQPSIEAQSNPATSAIAEPIPANIETASKPVSPLLSAEDVEPTVKALSNPILATESKAKIATSGTASGQELQALPNPSTTSTTAFTTLDPIIADSTDGKAENNPIDGITSISEPSSLEENSTQEQVTSVSQLSDVQPTDWAFQALQSLVERYGCIAGYPDGTFRGNRAMTRYEFAAGLNACLERINEIIASNTNNLAKKEDLLALQRLQEEFAAELATLRGRVDALEARTSELEANQFSTTTKLSGHVGTYIGDVFGKNADPENNSTFSYELNLNFLTSFTGKDSLVIALIAANNQTFNTATDYPSGRLSGATDETRLTFPTGVADGEIALGFLQYSFPVGDKLRVYLDAFSSNGILSAPITTLGSSSRGYVSLYGRIVALSAPVGLQSGIGAKWDIFPWLSLDVKAGSEFGAPNNPSIGLFNGGTAISFRPVISLGRLKMTAFYVHSYSPEFGINTLVGGNAAKVIGAGPVVANSYTGAMFYRVTPNIEVGGSVSYATARTLGSGTRGDARVWDYNINFTFYDLGKKGNVGGILLGMQPRLASTSNGNLAAAIGLPSGQRSDRNAGLHFETFYAHRIGDNITITPAFIWLTAPNHDKRNPDVFMGVIRTTFDF